jgi:hypothetical protein
MTFLQKGRVWPYAFEKTVLKKKGSNEKINMIVKKGGGIE